MLIIVVMIIRIVMMVTFHPLVVLLDIITIIITVIIQRPAINIDSPVFQTTNKASLIHSHFQTFCSQF